MKYTILFLIAFVGIFFASCTEEPPLNIDGLDLNEGKKWKANPETTEGIHNMIAIIEDDKSSSIEDYSILAEELGEEKTNIFKQCTMKGEAHENLHAYLIPLIHLIGDLSEDSTPDEAAKTVSEIKAHTKAYDFYFEN
jgi:hypothetical protein